MQEPIPLHPRKNRGFAHAGLVKIGGEVYPCQISDMSAAGAKLTFRSSFEVPDRFTLQLRPDGMIARACVVVWADGNHIGVLFDREA